MTVTLDIDEKIVERAREVAKEYGISLETIIGTVLQKIATDDMSSMSIEELIDEINVQSDGRKWSRKALYRY